MPIRPPEKLHALEVFLGSWQITGKNLSLAAADTMVRGNIFFQWMPGHFFITSQWHLKSGAESHIGMSVIGFDEAKQVYFMENYDNLGSRRTYTMRNDGFRWMIEGNRERGEIIFENPERYRERWEVRKDRHWEPLCELKVIKI